MLTQIDVDSEHAFFVNILGATPKDSLLIRKITGLNPPDVTLFIGDYSRDGGTYQGRRVGNRNVVITFDLNPNPALGETISGLRALLYKAFLDPLVDADFIKLNLHDDEAGVRYLVGYTEKLETEPFSNDSAVQISILCPDPYLRDDTETRLVNVSGWTTVVFTYAGTSETGFETEIYLNSATPTLTLSNNGKTMVISKAFASGDVVYVNTIRGKRSLLLANAADVDPLLDPAAWSSATTYAVDDVVVYNNMIYKATALGGNLNKLPDAEPTYWTWLCATGVSARWDYLKAQSLTSPLITNLSNMSPWIELHSQGNTMKVYGSLISDFPASVKTLTYTQAYWGA